MIIYYLMLILIIFVGLLSKNLESNHKIKKRFIIFSFGLMIIISSLRDVSVGTDLKLHYAKRFMQISSISFSELSNFCQISQYGIGFGFLLKIINCISSDVRFFIFITSIFIYSTIGWFINRTSKNVFMSTYLFFTFCMFYMYMNIISQAIAICIDLIAFVLFFYNQSIKRKRWAIILVIMSSFIHRSSLLFLGVFLLNNKKFRKEFFVILAFLIIIALKYYELIFIKVANLLHSEKYLNYIYNSVEGSGTFGLASVTGILIVLIPIILGCMFLLKKRKHTTMKYDINFNKREDDQILENNEELNLDNVYMFIAILLLAIKILTIKMNIINRFSHYFMPFLIILYPRIVSKIRLSYNKKVVNYGIYVFAIIYFVWMTKYNAHDYYGVVPYKLF